jgi:hypothetical protein
MIQAAESLAEQARDVLQLHRHEIPRSFSVIATLGDAMGAFHQAVEQLEPGLPRKGPAVTLEEFSYPERAARKAPGGRLPAARPPGAQMVRGAAGPSGSTQFGAVVDAAVPLAIFLRLHRVVVGIVLVPQNPLTWA